MLAVGGQKRSTTDNMQIYFGLLILWCRTLSIHSAISLWSGATVFPFISLRLLQDENALT